MRLMGTVSLRSTQSQDTIRTEDMGQSTRVTYVLDAAREAAYGDDAGISLTFSSTSPKAKS